MNTRVLTWLVAVPAVVIGLGLLFQLLSLVEPSLYFTWAYYLEVLIGGTLQGVMYSLVALGFVLIFKASSVFNFAQGSMVLFAALTMVGMIEWGLHWTLAFLITAGVMVVLALVIERVVLRPLVNQPHIILFMATIGIFYFLDGLWLTLWDYDVELLDMGIPRAPSVMLE